MILFLQVECDYHSKGKWFPARISNVRSDRTYDVIYDDGDKETKIPISRIRILERIERKKKGVDVNGDGPAFTEGSEVEARYKGGKCFWCPFVRILKQ